MNLIIEKALNLQTNIFLNPKLYKYVSRRFSNADEGRTYR